MNSVVRVPGWGHVRFEVSGMALLLNLYMWWVSHWGIEWTGSGAFPDEVGIEGKYSECSAGFCTE